MSESTGHQVVLRARTLDEAHQLLEPRLGAIRLRSERGIAVDLRLQSARVHDVSVHVVRYGVHATVTAPRTDMLHVSLPSSGSVRLTAGRTDIEADTSSGFVVAPSFEEGHPLRFRKGATVHDFLLQVPMKVIRSVTGQDDVAFTPLLDRRAPATRSWLRMVRVLREELDSGFSLVERPLTSSYYSQLLASSLLEAQPNSFIDSPVGRVPPAHLKRAVEAMRDAPERPWRIAELAAHAHCSARTLQMAFRSEYGHGPLAHLRQIRLEQAHADLLRADANVATVADIADSWGFAHAGRFSAMYRQTFGEYPSDTLRSR